MPTPSQADLAPQAPAPAPKGPAPRPRYWELAAAAICMAAALSVGLIRTQSKQAPAAIPAASPVLAPVSKAAPAPPKPESLTLILPPAQQSGPAEEEPPRPSEDSSGLVPYEAPPAEPAPKPAPLPVVTQAPAAAKPPAQEGLAPKFIPVKVAGPSRQTPPAAPPAQQQLQAAQQARPAKLPVPQAQLVQRDGPVQVRQPTMLRTLPKAEPAQPPVPAEPAVFAPDPNSPPSFCSQMAPVVRPGDAPAPAAQGWQQGTASLRLLGGCQGLIVRGHLLEDDRSHGYLNPNAPPVYYVYEFRNDQGHPVRYIADDTGRSWTVNVKPGGTAWLRWTRRLANR